MIAEDAITLVKALIQEAGCDGIYYCVQNAETFRFTSEEYHKFVEPYDLKVLDYAIPQDTWIEQPWDMGVVFVPPIAGR